MVNLETQDDAKRFLRDLGLIKEETVRAAIDALENGSSRYDLWASGKYKNGRQRSPICARQTANKIVNLYELGRLQPYWDYLVGSQPPLNPESDETVDSAQAGHCTKGQADDSLLPTQIDWSVVDINFKALLVREWFGRLVEFLEIHCGGDLIIMSDQVDSGYIRLRRWLTDLLASPGLEDLQEALPELPSSMHSLGEDADIAWEYGLRESLHSYKGQVLEFCVDLEPGTTDEKLIAVIREKLKPTDKFLRSLRQQKAQIERKFWADNKKGSSSVPSKSGPIPETLKRAILKEYKCDATWNGAVLVHEEFPDQILCDAEVQVFDLIGHPKDTRCYAWYLAVKGSDHRHPVLVRHRGQVDSPEKAVRAAIEAQKQRNFLNCDGGNACLQRGAVMKKE